MLEATVKSGRLVLSRKRGERIRIAENVWVTIHEIRGDKVRVMIEAPVDVLILRDECILPEERYNVVVRGNLPVVETDETTEVAATTAEVVPAA